MTLTNAAAERVAGQSILITVDLATRGRLKSLLRRESLNPHQIAAALGIELEVANLVIADAVSHRLVINVGSADFPIYTWRVEPGTTDADLLRFIYRLLSERPMSTDELAEILSIDHNHARRLVMRIPQHCIEVIAGRWFIYRLPELSRAR